MNAPCRVCAWVGREHPTELTVREGLELARSAADPFDGTVYRDLTNSAEAVEYASFLALTETGARDVNAAVDQIDIALHAMSTARSKLVAEGSETEVER